MPDKRYTKVEEEVMQILDRLESEKPAPARPNLRLVESRSASKRRFRRPKLQISQRLSGKPWMWIAIALGLAVAAVMLRDVSSNLALLVAILSICAFFAPLFVSRRVPGGPPGLSREVKQWRGRDISFEPPPGPSPAERLARWVQDRRRGGPRI